jgi:hypothetical protein
MLGDGAGLIRGVLGAGEREGGGTGCSVGLSMGSMGAGQHCVDSSGPTEECC